MAASFNSCTKDIQSKREECAPSVAKFSFHKDRVKLLSQANDIPDGSRGIVYWMSRDQRVQDNWACLYAQRLALKCSEPLHVCFCLVPKFLDATLRHFDFLLRGLREVEQECHTLDISFHLLIGEAANVLVDFVQRNKIGGVVTDFSPLRIPLQWVDDVKNKLPENVTFCQVDAHNIVPCWKASEKLEYAARTIRGKINRLLPEFLTEFPPVIRHPFPPDKKSKPIDWDAAEKSLEVDCTVLPVTWARPGTKAAVETLHEFCTTGLKDFSEHRNNPNKNALSNLSPWIHFGQISVQRCILTVMERKSKHGKSVEAFIEEATVRRELADNFCFYNKAYDRIDGANDWARKTLEDHKKDKRDYVYTRDAFEKAQTHDDLWNAAQMQMVSTGKMHGFLRMYWAKKILEWSESPESALQTAIYLNDRYELDGRDPNGYVGCMWSIAGIHDQGWRERPIFGKIRYMNYKGCQRKFDVAEFVRKYSGAAKNSEEK